jgi:5-methylcytosine-specific restriction endonuclease McrA
MPLKGYKQTDEHRAKLAGVVAPYNFIKGKPSWNKGICGSKSHSWRGGKAELVSKIRNSERYKKWHSDVFKRDGWTCQTCGTRGHGQNIIVHHIIPFQTILKKVAIKGISMDDEYILAMELPEMFDVNNGVTLCRGCHILVHKTKVK